MPIEERIELAYPLPVRRRDKTSKAGGAIRQLNQSIYLCHMWELYALWAWIGTAMTIQAAPLLASAFGWRPTLAVFGIGPLLGVEAMRRLARLQGGGRKAAVHA